MWQHAGSRVPPGSPDDAESAVRELVQDFATSFNTGNYDHCAALFVPEGQLLLSYREATYGQKAIEHTLRELADAGYEDLRLETIRVDTAGDQAMEVGRYSLSLRLDKGKLISDRGNYLAYWRRLGVWRINTHCFSSSVPRSWQDVQERQLRAVQPAETNAHDAERSA